MKPEVINVNPADLHVVRLTLNGEPKAGLVEIMAGNQILDLGVEITTFDEEGSEILLARRDVPFRREGDQLIPVVRK